MNRRSLAATVALCLFASLAFARNGVVRTKDGRSIEGDIADKGDQGVVITTKAGSVAIARADVETVDYAANVEEAYAKRLKDLPKDAGAREHLDLARWLYDQKAYDLAIKELDTVRRIDPNNADAGILRQTVERQAFLDRNRTATTDTQHTGPGPANPPVAVRPGDRKLLTPDQINTIRQFELRDTDTRVRVRFDNNVERRFVEYDSQDPKVFASKSAFTKAVEILKNGPADMRKDVRILSDPQSLADFKSRIQPMVLTGCAATACHGGIKAGDLVLYTPADNDAVTYTNFLILNRFTSTVGSGDQRVERKAIDRVIPANSLLVQYGLPRQTAEFRHPDLATPITPVFRGVDDPRYRQLLEWVRSDLIPVAPDYAKLIEYTPPTGTKAPAAENPAPPQETRTAEAPPPARNNDAANNNDDVRAKLDEARRKIRPTGGANSVPSPF